LIAAHPGASRRQLSLRLCAAWQWKQTNGAPRDMVCRELLLGLQRAGQIELPPVHHVHRNPPARRGSESGSGVPTYLDTTPLDAPLSTLRPLEFHYVRRTPEEPLIHSLLERHHYLGYTRPGGEHLKYLAWAQGRPLACLAWSSAPRHLGSRVCFIGWSAEARRRNIRFLAYNTRFLILPWIQVEHLASHILGRMVKRLSEDWEKDCRAARAARGLDQPGGPRRRLGSGSPGGHGFSRLSHPR